MKCHGFQKEDVKLFATVMDAVISDVLAQQLDIRPEEVAERFAEAALSGERDFVRLKAITLGATVALSSKAALPN